MPSIKFGLWSSLAYILSAKSLIELTETELLCHSMHAIHPGSEMNFLLIMSCSHSAHPDTISHNRKQHQGECACRFIIQSLFRPGTFSILVLALACTYTANVCLVSGLLVHVEDVQMSRL